MSSKEEGGFGYATPIPITGGSFTEQGITSYEAEVRRTLNHAFADYAHKTAFDLKLITNKSKFDGTLGDPRSASLRSTCKTLMSAFVKKLRKEMPFIGPNVLGIQQGYSAGSNARAFMLLDARPSTVRYVKRMEKFFEEEKLPYNLKSQVFKAGQIANRSFKSVCESVGVQDNEEIMGVVLDLNESGRYYDYVYATLIGEDRIHVGGESYSNDTDTTQLRNARKAIIEGPDLPAPHMIYYMPHICQAMSTLTRRLLCFRNADL